MRSYLVLSVLLGLLTACVPVAREHIEPAQATADLATFERLVAPFENELDDLGITVLTFQTYRYNGDNPKAFIEAINTFYRQNPGFCPLQEAFYPAQNGVQFMTLAGRNGLEIRGFLYDQSRRPRLTYAYFSGSSTQVLPATVCETIGHSS